MAELTRPVLFRGRRRLAILWIFRILLHESEKSSMEVSHLLALKVMRVAVSKYLHLYMPFCSQSQPFQDRNPRSRPHPNRFSRLLLHFPLMPAPPSSLSKVNGCISVHLSYMLLMFLSSIRRSSFTWSSKDAARLFTLGTRYIAVHLWSDLARRGLLKRILH